MGDKDPEKNMQEENDDQIPKKRASKSRRSRPINTDQEENPKTPVKQRKKEEVPKKINKKQQNTSDDQNIEVGVHDLSMEDIEGVINENETNDPSYLDQPELEPVSPPASPCSSRRKSIGSNSSKGSTASTEQRHEKSIKIIFPIWKAYFETQNVPEERQNFVADKIGYLNATISNFIVNALKENPEGCIPQTETELIVNKPQQSFNRILKVLKGDFGEKQRVFINPTCETKSCMNPTHYSIEESILKSGDLYKRVSTAAKNISDDTIIELVAFLEESMKENIKETVQNEIKSCSKSLVFITKITAEELVNRMKEVSCSLINDISGKIKATFSKFVWIKLTNGTRPQANYDNIILCNETKNQKVCLNISHQGLKNSGAKIFGKSYDDIIKIKPIPKLPEFPFPNEMQNKEIVETENENEDDIEADNDNIAVIEQEESEEEAVIEILKEVDAIQNNESLIDLNVKSCEKNFEEEEKAIALLLEKYKLLPNLPDEFKKNEWKDCDEWISLLKFGGQINSGKQPINHNENLQKASEFIEAKFKKGQGFHYEEAIRRMRLFLTCLEELRNESNNVLMLASQVNDDVDIDFDESFSPENLKETLNALTDALFNLTIKQINSKGFIGNNEWAIHLADKSITDSVITLKLYLCYLIASKELDMENLNNKTYHLNHTEAFRAFMARSYVRRGNFMSSITCFLRGKQFESNRRYDSKEYIKLKATSIFALTNSIGVALKYLGVFDLTAESFPLSSIAKNAKYLKNLKKTRISPNNDIWPILDADIYTFFERRPINSIVDLQYMCLCSLQIKAGWRISSIISVRGHALADSSPGLKYKDVKFFWFNNSLWLEITTPFHKTEKSAGGDPLKVSFICTNTKHCTVCYFLLLLELRNAFNIPLLEGLKKKSLILKSEKADCFLFANPDTTNRLNEEICLKVNHIDYLMRLISNTLRVPKKCVTFKSFRKGMAVVTALRILKENKSLTSLSEIMSILKSTKNWMSDACYQYLLYGNNELTNTIAIFKDALVLNELADPFDYHKYLKDIGSNDRFFFKKEDEIVNLIVDTLAPFWLSNSNKEEKILNSFIESRKMMVSDHLNQFLFYHDNSNVTLTRINLDTEEKLDFDVMCNFYTYSFTTEIDSKLLITCPLCEEINVDLKPHFEEHNELFECCNSSGATKNYDEWKTHMQNNHFHNYNCRFCHTLIPRTVKRSCERKKHNVVRASTLNLHWKKIEKNVMEKNQLSKNDLLELMQRQPNNPGYAAGIFDTLILMNRELIGLNDDEFSEVRKLMLNFK